MDSFVIPLDLFSGAAFSSLLSRGDANWLSRWLQISCLSFLTLTRFAVVAYLATQEYQHYFILPV